MDSYTLDVLSCHQKNILFLLFSHDLENSIEYFLLCSNIPALARNHSILLPAAAKVAYYLFLSYLQ